MKAKYTVAVPEGLKVDASSDVFDTLRDLLGIDFIGPRSAIPASNAITMGGQSSAPGATLCLCVHDADGSPEGSPVEDTIHFADDVDVPFPFRARSIRTRWHQLGPALRVEDGQKVLASSSAGALWTLSQAGPNRTYHSCLSLPSVPPGQGFVATFNGECFVSMLVLLHFLREVVAPDAYQTAPLRAAFIVDDPNLHWPTYGYVNYADLAAYGKRENCHFAFATIPLDTWFTHDATASTFRQNPRELSLLIHGNDHAKVELVRPYAPAVRSSLLQQAIRRIEHLEARSGLKICRVMVPPHGACSNDMLTALPSHGFEAACISSGSLRAHNPQQPWVRTLGYEPSESIGGCPVLPRWGLTGNVRTNLLVAAYLGQPLILRGHHQDFRDGLERFGEFARFINGLGNVSWSRLSTLSRLNYESRQDGSVVRIRPLSNVVEHEIDSRCTGFVLEAEHGSDQDHWHVRWPDGRASRTQNGMHVPVPGKFGGTVTIRRQFHGLPALAAPSLYRTDKRLVLRRLITEARDRLRVSI